MANFPDKPPVGTTINVSGSLGSKCVRAFLLNEGAGNSPRELVSGNLGTLQGSAGWSSIAGLGGTCLDLTAGASATVNMGANGLSFGNGNMTAVVGFRIPTIAAVDHIAGETAGGSTDGLFWGINDSGAPKFVLADVIDLSSGAFNPTVGDDYLAFYNYTRAGGIRYYFKNVTSGAAPNDVTVADANTPVTSANSSMIGNRRDSASSYRGFITLEYIFNASLSTAEMDALIANVYTSDLLNLPGTPFFTTVGAKRI